MATNLRGYASDLPGFPVPQLDLTNPEGVQISIANKVVHINVNGVCVLRISSFNSFPVEVEDNRR